jgi:exosortase/archaeosortase family protein
VTRRGLLVRVGLYFFLLALVVIGPWTKRGAFLGPIQATATAAVLHWIGVDATHDGDLVAGQGFSMRVAPVCDGLDFALILSLAILLSPVSWAARSVGILLALVISQVLNLVRLVCMFMVGIRFPGSFDLIHQLVWQVLAIVVAVGVYVAWADRVGATTTDAS